MNTKTRILLFCLSCLTSVVVIAKAPVARVVFALGDIKATDINKTRAVKRKSSLYISDTVVTGEKSRVQMRFIDGATLSLYQHASLQLVNYRFSDSEKVSELRLIKGALRTLTGQIAKAAPDRYRIDSDIATIGVRGTIVKTGLVKKKHITVQYVRVEGKGKRKLVVSPCLMGTDCDPGLVRQIASGTAHNSAIVRYEAKRLTIQTGVDLGQAYFKALESEPLANPKKRQRRQDNINEAVSPSDVAPSAEDVDEIDDSLIVFDDSNRPIASVSEQINTDSDLSRIALLSNSTISTNSSANTDTPAPPPPTLPPEIPDDEDEGE